MFWAYGGLSKMEKISVNSFIKNGFDLNIWTYGINEINMEGVSIRDAREIIPESLVFLNQAGSYAGFSDLFRYSVLCSQGGLWADTDIVALKPANTLPKKPFLVTERAPENDLFINGNIIFNPFPKYGNLIDLARVYAERFPKSEITWSEIGPAFLTAIIKSYPSHGFDIYPPEFANNINYWNCPSAFISENIDFSFSENMHFLHLYNEMWRKSGVDKNKQFSSHCLYQKIENMFNS
jgi:mannosyltransferase OCH1-like enzyme